MPRCPAWGMLVQVFGSFATGLFLPTSDMDLVVTGSGCGNVAQGLRALAQAFTRKGMVKNVQVTSLPVPLRSLKLLTIMYSKLIN